MLTDIFKQVLPLVLRTGVSARRARDNQLSYAPVLNLYYNKQRLWADLRLSPAIRAGSSIFHEIKDFGNIGTMRPYHNLLKI